MIGLIILTMEFGWLCNFRSVEPVWALFVFNLWIYKINAKCKNVSSCKEQCSLAFEVEFINFQYILMCIWDADWDLKCHGKPYPYCWSCVRIKIGWAFVAYFTFKNHLVRYQFSYD